MTDIELLKGTQLFSKLNDEELTAVARCVYEKSASPDTLLIREGEPGEALFLLRAGRVAIEKARGDTQHRLAELGAGAAFGEMALIDSSPTSASVRALEDCSLLCISRLDLNVLLSWDTVLGSKMWRSFTEMLSGRLRATNDKLLEHLGTAGPSELLRATSDLDAR